MTQETWQKVQQFIGWTVISIDVGEIWIQSPDKSREVLISHDHGVWDHGDQSESWLTIDRIDLD
jgi:hypothetical protein